MCPRTKEQNDVIRETRRMQILQAAAEVYIAKGIVLEMRDVAVHAGLGYGTVYHYYQNKHQLLDDLLSGAFDRAIDLTGSVLKGVNPRSPEERLRNLCQSLLNMWMNDLSVYILYKMAAGRFHHISGERIAALQQRFRNELYRPIAETAAACTGSRDPDQIANLLVGSLIGCAGLYIHHRQSGMDAEYVAEALMAGLRLKEIR